jgi:hypothetical protein
MIDELPLSQDLRMLTLCNFDKFRRSVVVGGLVEGCLSLVLVLVTHLEYIIITKIILCYICHIKLSCLRSILSVC